MSGPANRAVPLSQIVSFSPMKSGEALAVVREVGRRAHALADAGLDYALDAIRIDEMGGVRCRPSSSQTEPVPALAGLLEQLVSGPAAAEPGDSIVQLITGARTAPAPDLPAFLLQLQALIDDRSHDGGLRSLAVRAHANPTETSSDDPPSVTELWPYPQADPAAETWYQSIPSDNLDEELATPSEELATPSEGPSPTIVVPLDMESDAISLPDRKDEPRQTAPSSPPEASDEDGALDLPALIGVGLAAAAVGAAVAGGIWLFSGGG